ncbi:hypothetical protein TRFO_05666 [Tritrichomonas foetus]|uniref:Uncharacterized protein n=1 Tax=Tritrichomonas foetus TaxID=1144522 RepID=A0A1J4K9B1_9EUKA|nr:hypothetical protein TRFO_05666 [Tritrichomonas foetus]|eukprot:OHT06029.1 hypothetical protein TRFO_05666 [Tritrichomonas foetus]
MKSKLCPICQSLFSCKADQDATNLISQYISSFEVTYQSSIELLKDEKLSIFLQFLMTTLCSNPIPLPSSGPIPEIVLEILTFLNKLMLTNPILLNEIAASANLDILIPQFFSENISNNEIADQNANYLFLPLKFIALISSSKSVMLTSTPASHVLIIVVLSLLTNPQLAAWAASTLAGLLRNSPSFLSIIKVHPTFKCIKQKLTALLPSSDPCVVTAALSATVPLYSLGDDSNTAMKAALKYILEESYFPLSTQLCCWVISDLISKVTISDENFNLILQIPLNSSGVRAYHVLNLLVDFIDFHIRFGSIEYNRDIFRQVIFYQENYAATAGCQYLSSVYENYPDLLIGIDDTGELMKQTLSRYFQYSSFTDPERIEALIVQIRLLLMKNKVPESMVTVLTSHEEAIFMDFMRHIENNDSYLSVCFFNFLLICSKSIQSWAQRIKRVLVDSQFPALLVHVLTNSKNRRAISDSLRALQFFMNNCEFFKDNTDSFFFTSAVSGFLLMNQQLSTEMSEMRSRTSQERHDFEITISKLTNEKNHMEIEMKSMSKMLSDEKVNTSQSHESISKLKDDLINKDKLIARLQKKLQLLKEITNEQNVRISNTEEIIKKTQTENSDLKKYCKKLEKYRAEYQRGAAENGRFKETIQDLEAKLAYSHNLYSKSQIQIDSLRKELSELENSYSQMQKRCQESQEMNTNLMNTTSNNKSEIHELNETINSLNDLLSKETAKTGKMAKTIADIQDEKIKLQAIINNEANSKEKYRLKKKTLLDKIKELERERRKWESVAKFNQHVCTVKKVAVQDVYGEFQNINFPSQ